MVLRAIGNLTAAHGQLVQVMAVLDWQAVRSSSLGHPRPPNKKPAARDGQIPGAGLAMPSDW
jgi:hypothetical protein